MTTVGDWWAEGKRRVEDLARRWRDDRRAGGTAEATAAGTGMADTRGGEPSGTAPDCTNLSKLIRLVCAERQTSSVWWVVVTDSTADVYPLPGLARTSQKPATE